MKVSASRSRASSFSPSRGEAKRGVEVRHSAFLEALQAAENKAAQSEIHREFQSVEAAARALKESPTLENLNAYKRAIHDFIERVINQAYSVHHVRTFSRKGRPVLSVLVRTIDEQLEELARQVLSNAQDATAIAAKIDDIRGIILDYFR